MMLRRLLPFALTALLFSACSDPEDCATIGDEDANGLSDCQDTACASLPQCAAEICDNGVDDNGNGATDCQEISCATQIKCQPEVACDDGLDNNLDGNVDCADPDCSVSDPCIEIDAECDDNSDNDNDGDTDCDDSDCTANPACFPETSCGQGAFTCCSDGQDNNGDGLTDCADPGCADPCLTLNCGNGQLNAGEACDDGNNTSGDCCASDCSQVTCDSEIEPNNTSTEATGPLEIPSSIAGSITPVGDVDFYSVNLTIPGKIRFETSDGSGLGNCVNADTTINVFNTNGTSALGSDTDAGVGLCSLFTTGNLTPGIYFVKVSSGVAAATIPIYQLHVSGIICGNGSIDPGSTEECDNGLNCTDLTPCTGDAECTGIGDGLCKPRAGDGCDAICKREPVCGDNILTNPPEQCDDGSTCADGTTTCNGNATLCVGIGDESCTAKSGDGCDANCKITGCRNGVVTAGEECDDGNAINGDGCDSDCTLSTCGNNIIGAPEDCDGTALGGASCVSLGFASGTLGCIPSGQANACNFDTTACVASICGNNVTETGEECDDGNAVSGDSCSSACQFEIVFETEPNDASATATGPFSSPFLAEGGLVPATEGDFYSFVLSSFGAIRVETFDGAGPPTCATIDTKVDLFNATNLTTALVSDDNDGTGNCSLINPTVAADAAARALPPGTYFIKVSKGAAAAAVANPYRLQVSLSALCGNGVTEIGEVCDDNNLAVGDGCDNQCRTEVCGNNRLDANEQCDDGNTTNGDCCSSTCTVEAGCFFETEANNTSATANGPLPFATKGAGGISPATDVDFYSFVLASRSDIKIETKNITNTACTSAQDTLIKFIAPDGTTQLALNNDISTVTPIDRCSRLDGTGNLGAGAAMRNLSPGTYFVSVEKGGTTAPATYRLIITAVATCGNGAVENSEPCDDGNQISADGCENNCIITPACGNGLTEPSEECDDGRTCDDNTTVCSTNTSLCNGIGTGACTAKNGDGCDATCQREPLCGDLLIDAPEQCDDGKQCSNGNTCTQNSQCAGIGDAVCIVRNGDCCSTTCTIEPGCVAEIEPNNTSATTTVTLAGGQKGFGAIGVATDLDFYALTIPAEADVKLQTTNGTNQNCSANQDTILRFFNTNGTTQIDFNDDIIANTNRCSILDPSLVGDAGMKNLAPGTYFISVEDKGNNSTISLYNLVVTFTALCGNGTTEAPNEACDDGNLTNGDGCEANCTVTPACGNLLVEGSEQCDDGKRCANGTTCTLDAQCAGIGDNLCLARSGDGCDSTCRDEFCGDQITNDTTETCDDGNTTNTDSCLNTCRLAACGDGVVFGGVEACDNGANNSDTAPNACRTDCSLPSCGDGAIDTGELCDDGNTISGDGCDASCDIEFCGDGIDNATIDLNGDGDTLDAGESDEECDDANGSNSDDCTNSCKVATCGDGFTFNTAGGSEQCDDGNFSTGDGCDAFCFIEQTAEIEPNNSIAQAQTAGINITLDQLLIGAINPIGDTDFFQITLAAPKTMHLETFDANFGSCTGINTVIEVFNSAGTKLTTADNGGIGLCSKTNIALSAGTFFVKVSDAGNNDVIPAYSLFIDFP